MASMVCCYIISLQAWKSPLESVQRKTNRRQSAPVPLKRKTDLSSCHPAWSGCLLGLLPASEPIVPALGTRTPDVVLTLSLREALERRPPRASLSCSNDTTEYPMLKQ